MKRLLLALVLTCFSWISIPQAAPNQKEDALDSLIVWVSNQIKKQKIDTALVYENAHKAMHLSEAYNKKEQLAISYRNLAFWHKGEKSLDSTNYYLDKAENIYLTLKKNKLLAETYLEYEDIYKGRSVYSQAMEYDFKALSLFEKDNDLRGVAICYTRLCDLLYFQEKYEEGAEYCQKAIDIQKQLDVPGELSVSYRYKADNLLLMEHYDDALLNINQAISVLKKAGKPKHELLAPFNTRGNIYKFLKRYDDALSEYKKNYHLAKANNKERDLFVALANIGHIYRIQENFKEALPYTLEAIDIMKKTSNTQNLWENYFHAADSYKALGNLEKALKYEQLYAKERLKVKDQIIQQLESELQIKYETAKKDETIVAQDAKIDRQRKSQLLYISIAGLLGIILFGMYFTIKNIANKRKKLVSLNEDLEVSNDALSKSLEELQLAQKQLIQSEKMASLGELTAGIAHEIQNPLNFVINFSEISNELVDEMTEEIGKGDTEEAKTIAINIKQNLDKITHHGQRADSIVKGMLQHSRKSDGQKKPTNINALADEYLRLAYHGLRAKDKSFNATLETDFDESIGKINIIPQDIGRVILNLITNAFYACNEKSSYTKASDDGNYKSTVWVSTRKNRDKVIIMVKDNGNGIPKEVLDKIFQPFFTTKPTGKGTGLGLSLSYDIIKAHGGNLRVSTEENIGTEFIISIPISN